MADPEPTLSRQRALAINSVSSILNAADHWAEPETCDALVTAVLDAHTPASGQQPKTAPTPCICGHQEQQHIEDVCQACGCGDYLQPADAHTVIKQWRDAALEARAQLAAAQGDRDGWRDRAHGYQADIKRVRDLHVRNENTGDCEECSTRDYPDYAVPHPCPTIRALDAAPWADPNADILGDLHAHIDEISGRKQP